METIMKLNDHFRLGMLNLMKEKSDQFGTDGDNEEEDIENSSLISTEPELEDMGNMEIQHAPLLTDRSCILTCEPDKLTRSLLHHISNSGGGGGERKRAAYFCDPSESMQYR
jgi:hypothetical protein